MALIATCHTGKAHTPSDFEVHEPAESSGPGDLALARGAFEQIARTAGKES